MAVNVCNEFIFLPFRSLTSYTTQIPQHRVKLDHNIMKGTEYFVPL